MQPVPESYSTPRRPLEVEDYIDIVRRHKAWILGPTFGALVVSVVIAFMWPDTYVSSAMIRVVPPTVPENYVPTNINIEMSQRINAMAQTILSRGNLTNIVNTFNLYQKDRQRKPMEDVIEDMKRAIKIGQVTSIGNQRASAFTIAFSYDNRIVAQKVTADLVSRFMAENTRDRTNISVMTTQFLKDQVENARKDLEAIEDKLAKFRMANQGRLPDQLQNNQVLLNAAEARIGNINSAIAQIGQEKMLRESELRTQKTRLASLSPATMEDSVAQRIQNDKLIQNERAIQQMELAIESLKQRYRPSHPDVQNAEANLALLKKEHERLAREDAEEKKVADTKPAPAKQRVDPRYLREKQDLDGNIARLETEIHLLDKRAEEYQRDMKTAEQQVGLIRSRIESEPIGEKEYAEVIRDRETARMAYNDLKQKMSRSEIAEEVEKRQQGEQLEVLDPASLPASPTEPKRPVIIAVGTAMGLVLGLALAVGREAKDASLKNLKDVRAYTRLTILGSVPLLENDLVVRRRKRLTWLAWSTACSVGIIIMTGSVFYYFTTRV